MNNNIDEIMKSLSDSNVEAQLISTLMYHPEFIHHSNYLKAGYFYNKDNHCLYWAINELFRKKITNIDAINLENAINSNAAIKRTWEKYHIPDMQQYIELCALSKRDTVEEYKMLATKVTELAFKRDYYKKTLDWQKLCVNPEVDLSDMSTGTYKQLNELTTQYVTDGEITTFGSKVKDIWKSIKAKKERGEGYGIPSAFKSVNEYFTYEETELIVVSARMKRGKSIFAMVEALDKAMNGVPTFVQDSEMSDENWYVRVISYLTGIPVKRIKDVELTKEEEELVDNTNSYVETLPLFHNYDPYITKEKFYSICSQKKIELGLKFVIWDYIKCDDSILGSAERSAYMGGMTNWLKNIIAGELKLSVLALCQLNRGNEVAESDGIERYCSTSVMWQEKTEEEIAEDGAECGNFKLKVKLNRLGKQHMGEHEYIDMVLFQNKLGIGEAKKQHKTENLPFA